MKAVLRTTYGSPDVLSLGTVEKPIPKNNEILVKVYATTVNRTDCGILRGQPFPIRFFTGLLKPRSAIPGTDFAGRVEEIGQHVTAFQVGDRVWGFHDDGLRSQAEYLTIGEHAAVTLIPKDVPYETIVACGEGAHYAYNFINYVTIKEGTRVLVNGATGAVGSSLVQLLKYYGAYVTAVGNTQNIALITSWGADKTIDYLQEDFTQDEEQYHYLFDTVSNSSFGRCKHLLLPDGAYLSSELGPNAQNVYLSLTTPLFGKKRVVFPIPKDCRRSVRLLTDLVKEKKFDAVIDRTYPLDQIKEAYRYVERGEKTGNVIITY